MKCEYCDRDLTISKNETKSAIETTDVFSIQTLVCTNAKCKAYCGPDLSSPLQVARTIKTKVG